MLGLNKQQKIWCKRDSEVVVAAIESPDKTNKYILRQREINSLAPHNWLLGEVNISYITTITFAFIKYLKFQINHLENNLFFRQSSATSEAS